ncbi:P22AR C-terminal domain-containing protein [Xenorhabdus taiwanensis]|uniref:Phage repressor protein/antirepressor Ant n=1 Tax=Xenorhabdus taiwanensis TaxID=3085177 RepID=A0ABM8JYX7_9GAMM|nr:phage repressor protein/antirepressor Ant [Xenorhabdus sp. TCT-1]
MTSIAISKTNNTNQLTFRNTVFNPISHANKIWFTAVELAKALEYKKSDAVTQIYERNSDEFTSTMTETLKLSVSKKSKGCEDNLQKTVRVFSLRGAHLVAMFSKTSVAKEFRKWVLDILDREVEKDNSVTTKTTVQQRNPLKNAVNLLVSKKGIMYPEAYSLVHQRFNVESIDELTVEQLPLAVEYVHKMALEGELLSKEELPAPKIQSQLSNDELITLCWSWHYLMMCRSVIEDIYPLLDVAEHKLAKKFYSIPKETAYNSGMVQSILQRLTAHLEPSTFDNSRILNNLRRESLTK